MKIWCEVFCFFQPFDCCASQTLRCRGVDGRLSNLYRGVVSRVMHAVHVRYGTPVSYQVLFEVILYMSAARAHLHLKKDRSCLLGSPFVSVP